MTDFDTVQKYMDAVKAARDAGRMLELSHSFNAFHLYLLPRYTGDSPEYSSDSIDSVLAYLKRQTGEQDEREKKKYWYND